MSVSKGGSRGGGGGAAGSISGGRRQARQRLRSGKQRTPSSRAWLERQLNDPYVAAAKRAGYRSRAAYKLAEIDARFHILKPGQRVVDLGAAPGGWSQVAAEKVRSTDGKGQVVAIDLLAVEPITGTEVIQLDFMDAAAPDRLKAMLRGGRADVVLSDMAAQGTGHARTDHLRIIGLAEAAAEFAFEVLEPGGAFVCKVFQGGSERGLLEQLKRAFTTVRHVKPPASRAESAEMYVVATGFRGIA
ncbi:MAG TPA: RlmE family RNA methyltransferase [Hyphomicrobiaceae bacterium]|nr:RlmE family RNA methyltransferase [Hyphomicrobiaceae bacterium]